MADYYSVLARAVAALPENTAAGRRAIYEKARTALVRQLENLNPPLPPAEIAKQRLALEEAVRRIESETARAAFSAPRPQVKPAAPRAEPPPLDPAAGGARVEPERPEPRLEAPRAPIAPPATGAPRTPVGPVEPALRRPAASSFEPPQAAEPSPAEPAAPRETGQRREPGFMRRGAAEPAAVPAPTVSAVAVPTAADPDDADEAAAPAGGGEVRDRKAERIRAREERLANRRRRSEPVAVDADDVAAMPADPEPVAQEPAAPSEPWMPGGDEPKPAADAVPPPSTPVRTAKPAKPARRPKAPMRPLPLRPLIGVAAVLLVLIAIGASAYAYRETLVALYEGSSSETAAPAPVAEQPADGATATADGATTPPAEEEAKITDRLPGDDAAAVPDSRSVQTSRIVANPGGASPAAEPDAAAPPSDAATPGTNGTTADGAAPAAGSDTAAPGGEAAPAADATAAAEPAPELPPPADSPDSGLVGPSRSILYEDGEVAGTRGVALPGTAKWEMVRESIGNGPEEPIVRATVTVPERSVTATLIFRRNRDQALPASHLIEVAFELPVNFVGGGITNLPAIVMKTSESARGDALIGASARVSDGLFWIALSSSESDVATNLELLRDRGWIDLPMLYNNGRRAILTIEKGSDGAKALDDALDAWAAEQQ